MLPPSNLRSRAPSPLRPVLGCGALAAGAVLVAIVTTGQLPENPDLFDLTNAASALVLAVVLIAAGLDQILAFRQGMRDVVSELEHRLALAELDLSASASTKAALEIQLSASASTQEMLEIELSAVRQSRDTWKELTEAGIAVARRASVVATQWSEGDHDDRILAEIDAELAGVVSGMAEVAADSSNVVRLFKD